MSEEFKVFWKPFIRGFQAFCMSHYSIYRPNFQQNYRKCLPFVIYFVVCSATYILFVFSTIYSSSLDNTDNQIAKEKGRPLMFYVNALSTLGSYATHLAITLETIVYGKREREICEKLEIISDIFATKLNYIPDYHKRRMKYIYRTVFLFVVDIFMLYASYLGRLLVSTDPFYIQPTVVIGVMILRIRWCQIALFLNVIADTLDDLQVLLKQQQIQSSQESNEQPPNKFTCEKMQYFRDIYSNLWLITNCFDDCFGWSLIAFLIKVTLELIDGAYRFYISIRLNDLINSNIGAHYLAHILVFNASLVIVFWYFCSAAERCQNKGKSVSRALHESSNYRDPIYQRHVRLFSLQLKELPIKICIKEMFVFNYTMLKSTVFLMTTYVAIVIQFQIADENVSLAQKSHLILT